MTHIEAQLGAALHRLMYCHELMQDKLEPETLAHIGEAEAALAALEATPKPIHKRIYGEDIACVFVLMAMGWLALLAF